jgi:hypothetical protein
MAGIHDFPIFDAFVETGDYSLLPEFVETLVNDGEIPAKLRRQIWTLASTTSHEGFQQIVAEVVASFQDSEDAHDLLRRWAAITDNWWPRLPECPLKKEIDELS